jgi:hypothetical protein
MVKNLIGQVVAWDGFLMLNDLIADGDMRDSDYVRFRGPSRYNCKALVT